MALSKRPSIYSLPSYSLTGDLLGFLRCGLQYRYTRIGQLPASRPVQAWFGSFIHGVLEEAYRRYDAARKAGRTDAPPWSDKRIQEISDLIKKRLAAQGLFPWDQQLEEIGDMRAKAAINELGPHLFPLIHRAEVRLTGARRLPLALIPERYRFRRADRYEMVGIIDVISHVQFADPALNGNILLTTLVQALGQVPANEFELIIDYKGMRRPPIQAPAAAGPSFWDIYGWQVQTYAHLRSTHEDSWPVAAGVIIYLNELTPTRNDLQQLRRDIRGGATDVVPLEGSLAWQRLDAWREDDEELPELPLEFRLQRALRVVPTPAAAVQESLVRFDEVVARIEKCRGRELAEGRVLTTWEKNPEDDSTCTACDARTFCPSYTKETRPRLPGVRPKR